MTEPKQVASTGHTSPGSGGDYDPESIPIRSAATVLILADKPDLQVLMLKRNARSIFVGDMWVYPGGAVDPEDATPEADAVVEKPAFFWPADPEMNDLLICQYRSSKNALTTIALG